MLKVYWWRKKDGMENLGDEITHLILRELCGKEVKKVALREADYIGAGSILGNVYESPWFSERKKPLYVVGSGLMHSSIQEKDNGFLKFLSVRGYLTKVVLGEGVSKETPIGDPGILISDIVSSAPVEKKYKFGIILHIGSANNCKIRKLFSHIKNSVFLDIATSDVERFSREMQQCDFIVSQSLHGLIFADSLGIPNCWLDLGALHKGGEFKFYDYFSSINRPFSLKLSEDDLVDECSISEALYLPGDDVEIIKESVREVYIRSFC